MTTKSGHKRRRNGNIRPSKPYQEYLLKSLQDPAEAAGYLNAAMEDADPRVFLLALRDVASARNIGKVARDSGLNRENAYRILSGKGNPRLSSLASLLKALNLRLAVEAKP